MSRSDTRTRHDVVEALIVERFTHHLRGAPWPAVTPDDFDLCAERQQTLEAAVESLPQDRCPGCHQIYGDHGPSCTRRPQLVVVHSSTREAR